MTDAALEKIETLLAHHDRQLQDLNDVITQQWKEIDLLKARLKRTQEKLSDLEATASDPQRRNLSVAEQAAQDKPPHY